MPTFVYKFCMQKFLPLLIISDTYIYKTDEGLSWNKTISVHHTHVCISVIFSSFNFDFPWNSTNTVDYAHNMVQTLGFVHNQYG